MSVKDILEVPEFAEPTPAEEMLPRHMGGGHLIICIDGDLLITKFKGHIFARLVSQCCKRLNKGVDCFLHRSGRRPIRFGRMYDGPPFTRRVAGGPGDALIGVVKRASYRPFGPSEIRKPRFQVGANQGGRPKY